MCISYRGTDYHYGFDVTFQSDSDLWHFHILMTKYLTDRPYVYGGVCLDNGLQVNTVENEWSAALWDIIRKVINGAISVEKVYANRYPGKPVQSFKNIMEESPSLHKKFKKRMAKAFSLEEYDNFRRALSPLREKPKFDPEYQSKETLKSVVSLQYRKVLAILTFLKILPHCVPILYDCKDVKLALNRVQKDPLFYPAKIKYRRV